MTIAVVHASGDGRDIGRTYGEALAAGIHESLEFYKGLKHDPPVDLSGYVDAGRAAAPSIADEIEGMAQGAGISIEDAWWLNCLEEVAEFEACTTMINGRWLMHAEQWYAGHSSVGVVIAHPQDGPEFISPTCAGFLPAVGLNSTGFAQGIDSLSAPDDRVGVPRAVVSRASLGANGMEAAIEAACMTGRAGGYAHVLASTTEHVIVETSATSEHVLRDVDAHTNHYLSTPPEGTRPPSRGSASRLSRAIALLDQQPPRTIEDCTELLADHNGVPQSICLHEAGRAGEATVFGMVCDVTTGQMLVSDGPPCTGRWEEFSMPLSEARFVG